MRVDAYQLETAQATGTYKFGLEPILVADCLWVYNFWDLEDNSGTLDHRTKHTQGPRVREVSSWDLAGAGEA